MIVDFENLPTDETFDFCIAGSGPAGLTIAIDLARQGKKVLVLEGGGREWDERWQDLANGENIGDPYIDLDATRLRQFGGSSNHWAGWCRPLDEVDFQHKDHNHFAAWPIAKSDLDPYFAATMATLDLEGDFTDQVVNDRLQRINFLWSSPPTRFGEKYADEIEVSDSIVVALGCAVSGIRHSSIRVSHFLVNNIEGRTAEVSAQAFVLACGGIENVRLLMHFNEVSEGSLLGEAATLGRFWMEHPHFTIGEVAFESASPEMQFFSLTPDAMRELGVLNCGLRVQPLPDRSGIRKIAHDLSCAAPRLGEWFWEQAGRRLVCIGVLGAAWEQAPNPDSRIKLSRTRRDTFGIPLAQLDWKKTALDIETARAAALELGGFLARSGNGRVRLNDWLLNNGSWPSNDSLGGNHHMGGTRMSASAAEGVVDPDLKVWSKENLYIAGSSVFPSGGHANPTFTIVQLSHRLADHLSRL